MATTLGPTLMIAASDIFTTSTTPQQVLGDKAYTADGRSFRYAFVQPSSGGATNQPTGTTLVTGNVLQGPIQIAGHLAQTPAAAAIGDSTITITALTTAVSANQYAGGYAFISTAPGNGFAYLIKSHPLASAAGSLIITLSDTIAVALTTSSRVDLQANIYNGVLQAPAAVTSAIVGVAFAPIPATVGNGSTVTPSGGSYGWIQTKGPSAALSAANNAVGVALTVKTTAGSTAAAIAGDFIIGTSLATGVTGKNNAVYLTID